jgi:hypothetical protein
MEQTYFNHPRRKDFRAIRTRQELLKGTLRGIKADSYIPEENHWVLKPQNAASRIFSNG